MAKVPAALFKINPGEALLLEKRKQIRKFRSSDREQVTRIFIDNAFAGEGLADYFPRFGFLAWAMMGRYFIFRRDFFWVAQDEKDQVIGFICGDTEHFCLNLLKIFLPAPVIAFWFILDAPFITRRGWDLLGGFFWSLIRGEFNFNSREIPRDYPAHLHINIAPGLQQKGLGSELMEIFLQELEKRSIKGVHLRLYDGDDEGQAYRFFKKFSFKEATRKEASFMSRVSEEKKFLITMVRKIERG